MGMMEKTLSPEAFEAWNRRSEATAEPLADEDLGLLAAEYVRLSDCQLIAETVQESLYWKWHDAREATSRLKEAREDIARLFLRKDHGKTYVFGEDTYVISSLNDMRLAVMVNSKPDADVDRLVEDYVSACQSLAQAAAALKANGVAIPPLENRP